MLARLARGIVAHPWRVLVLWAVGVGLAIALTPNLASYTTSNQQAFLPGSFESVQAQQLGEAAFPAQSGASGQLVVSRPDGAPLTPANQTAAAHLAATLQGDHIPGVVAVTLSPRSLSPNGRVEALVVTFAGQPGQPQVNTAVGQVRTGATSALAGSGLQAGLTGNAAIQVDTTNAYDHANTVVTVATVVLIVVLLGLIFRSPIIAVLPLVVIGLVHEVTTGLTAAIASAFGFPVSNSLPPLLVVVLFGIGTDYLVFLIFRYRERLRRGEDHTEALVFATSRVGKVIASSALTVMGAFAALLLAKLGSLSSLAPGLIIAVALMLVTALTLVPALFAILGRHLFWPLGPGRPGRGTQVGKEARLVARHPGAVAAVVGTVLVGLAVASISYTPTYNTLSELPASTPSQQAYNTLLTGFPPGALAPTQVYVTSAAPLTQASLGGVTATLSSTPGVAGVSPPQLSADARTALISVVLADNPYSNTALDLVGGPLPARAQAAAGGNRVLVGGQTATLANVRQALHSSMKVVFPVAFGIIALILGALLEAVLAPVNLLVCVGLTVAATLGATSLVFLEGAGRSGIDFTLPIVIYLFVVAIGTDYNILLSSRLREEYLGGFLPRDAARAAVTNDAPTVAAAGIILAGTFASLTLAGIANLTELGFAVSVGILLAAFGVAPLLVTALSALEGHRFWWPGHARGVTAPRSPPSPQVDGAHGRAAADGGNGQVGAEELPQDPAPPRGD